MKYRIYSLFVICALLTTGCASTFQIMENAPVKVDKIKSGDADVIGTVSLAARRRTVIVGLSQENLGKFCAEPPPEVAENVSTEVEAAIEGKIKAMEEAKGSIKDKYVATIVKLSERTVLLDIYRTGTYSLCQYHVNGAMGPHELIAQFDKLTDKVLSKVSVATK